MLQRGDFMVENLKLDRSEKKFKVLFDNSPIGMAMVIHATGEFIEVNPSLLASTGYTKEEFLSLSYWDITPREYEEQENNQIVELNETGKFGPNYKEYIRKDGSRYPLKISGFKLTDVDGTEVVWGIIEDISERVAFEKKLKELASIDHLTEVVNRRGLEEQLELMISMSRRTDSIFAYLAIDLDKFKDINDEYGHHAGDQVLIEVAKRMTKFVSRASDIVSRIGGDEFVIILSDVKNLSENFLNQLNQEIKSPIKLENNLISVSASIGVAIYPDDGTNYEELYKKADKRTYQVKSDGGDAFRM